MYNSKQRLERAKALRDPSLVFRHWVSLHSSLEEAIFGLCDGAIRKDNWQWPENLTPDIRSMAIVLHTIGSYRSGGWAVGVIANGLHVLPFVPEALERLGYATQAECARRSIALFPEGMDFSGPSTAMQAEAVNNIEKWSGYNDFLTEIEDQLEPDWEYNDGKLPQNIIAFAERLKNTRIWLERA